MGCSTTKPTSYPKYDGYVTDIANILTDQEEADLELILKEFDPLIQMVVVSVLTTQPMGIEQYTIGLANEWKVGYANQVEDAVITDNGIVLLIAVEDRDVRIEVGSGAESFITDAEAGRILDDFVVPKFKEGKWYEGILSGISAISDSI